MTTQVEAIQNFLRANGPPGLRELYHPGMEVQVNAAQDDGDPIQIQLSSGRTSPAFQSPDTGQIWKSFRIPFNAMREPEYDLDKEITWNLSEHCEGIGMTGWDWKARRSRWFAFDFDSIANHQGGLNDEELDKCLAELSKVPYVEIRRSTSGKGYHPRIYLATPEPTANHTEHAALAKAILAKVSALVGFDLRGPADAEGGNVWVWHRKSIGKDRAFELVKPHEELLTQVPMSWRDYLEEGRRTIKRKVPQGIVDPAEFENKCNQQTRVDLDETHRKLIQWLAERPYYMEWDPERWLMVTHTYALQEAHKALGLRGIFETLSQGSEVGDHNCFAFPEPNGSWLVGRYGNPPETSLWERRGKFKFAHLNRELSFEHLCGVAGGLRRSNSKDRRTWFEFTDPKDADKALGWLGIEVQVPFPGRQIKLERKGNDQGVLVHVRSEKDDPVEIADWVKTHGWWTHTVNLGQELPKEEDTHVDCGMVRHIHEGSAGVSWCFMTPDGRWIDDSRTQIKDYLGGMGYASKEVDKVIQTRAANSVQIVNWPFQPEYPKPGVWNRYGAQFAVVPNITVDPSFPTWSLVLEHAASTLTPVVKEHPWCQANGIATGGQWLTLVFASIFQDPTRRTVYVFFYSPEENTGKTVLIEEIGHLITKGVVKVEQAFKGDFNGEMRGAIICVVEELHFGNNKAARMRVKDWTTADSINIHAKNQTPFMVPNTTHFFQAANQIDAAPLEPGDTRIAVLRVPTIPKEKEIEKRELKRRLRAEAPDFLGYLLKMNLPKCDERVYPPVLQTRDKEFAESMHETPYELFFKERVYPCDGNLVPFKYFRAAFQRFLDDLGDSRADMADGIKVRRQCLQRKFPVGYLQASDEDRMVANVSLDPKESCGFRWIAGERGLLKKEQFE